MKTPIVLQIAMKLYAHEIVRAVYRGIFGREPDKEGLRAYAKQLNNSEKFAYLIDDIAASKEAWERNIRLHADEIVSQLYLGILKREPDTNGMQSRAAFLRKTGEIHGLLQRFISTKELIEKFSKNQGIRRFHPFNKTPNDVELTEEKEKITSMLNQIKMSWNHLGITRAHHSVLTNEIFLPENLKNNIDTFWESGKKEATSVKEALDRVCL